MSKVNDSNGFATQATDSRATLPGHGQLAKEDWTDLSVRPLDAEFLRRCAWEIGEQRPADAYQPTENHVGLAIATPNEGFVHWRIRPEWVDTTARSRQHTWHDCRLVLRLYDITYIDFNGFNAHRVQDFDLPALLGQRSFRLDRPGTWQLGEVGFVLRNGEFIPAARSQPVAFPPTAASQRGSQAALLVTGSGSVEDVADLWDQDRILRERLRPKLRQPLRIASFAFASSTTGQDGSLATFVTELAAGQAARGHAAHVFVPARPEFTVARTVDGVHYHPLPIDLEATVLEQAHQFGEVADDCLGDLPPFDLIHRHEWMTAFAGPSDFVPAVLSLGSIEATRRNGSAPTALSLAIAEAERARATEATCILTPPWLRDRAIKDLDLDNRRVFAFPMEGRLPNAWEAPLDHGHAKMEIGFGPLDRLVLFVGPLEYGAGVDLLLEALPVLLNRAGNVRLAYVGMGPLYGQLQHRANQLGIGYAVRLVGHRDRQQVIPLFRAAEALVLPSRWRVPQDDAVVDLARRAGRPVITTHGGPAHLVRHEENGLVTYDNPGSMVWALDRLLADRGHADRLGRNGYRVESDTVTWGEVAAYYLEHCASCFNELAAKPQW